MAIVRLEVRNGKFEGTYENMSMYGWKCYVLSTGVIYCYSERWFKGTSHKLVYTLTPEGYETLTLEEYGECECLKEGYVILIDGKLDGMLTLTDGNVRRRRVFFHPVAFES